MFALLEDAKRVRGVFFDFGAIPKPELDEWVKRNGVVLPCDLLQFWELTGGGDVFDSETILRPTVLTPPNASFVDDEVERCNKWAVHEGMAPDLYVFHRGAFFYSAIRLSDQKYVTLSGAGFTIVDTFNSFDDWYVRTLRVLYADGSRLARA